MRVDLLVIASEFVARKLAEETTQQSAINVVQITAGAAAGGAAVAFAVGLWWYFRSNADKEREESVQKQKNILTQTFALLRDELQVVNSNIVTVVNQAKHIPNTINEYSMELPNTLNSIVQIQNDIVETGTLFDNTVKKIKAELAEISVETDEITTLITGLVSLVDAMNTNFEQHYLTLEHLHKRLVESDAQIDELTGDVADLIVKNLEQGKTITTQNEEIMLKDSTITRIWSSHKKIAQQNLLFRQGIIDQEEPVNEPSRPRIL